MSIIEFEILNMVVDFIGLMLSACLIKAGSRTKLHWVLFGMFLLSCMLDIIGHNSLEIVTMISGQLKDVAYIDSAVAQSLAMDIALIGVLIHDIKEFKKTGLYPSI